MIRVFHISMAFIHIIMLLKYADAKSKMSTTLPALPTQHVLLFRRFKENFNKIYPVKASELKGYKNFGNNLTEVIKLNSKHSSNVNLNKLNRYADLDPEEKNERFGVQITPYDNVVHESKDELEAEDYNEFPEDMQVYDQDAVDDMYTTWIKKWGKPALKKKLTNAANYYSLVKTAVESNKQNFEGNNESLGKDA